MCRDLTWYIKICFARTTIVLIFVPIGISLYSYVVDISSVHAVDDVFPVERTGSQLFSWCDPYTCPATTAICYGTLSYQTVVCIQLIITVLRCIYVHTYLLGLQQIFDSFRDSLKFWCLDSI